MSQRMVIKTNDVLTSGNYHPISSIAQKSNMKKGITDLLAQAYKFECAAVQTRNTGDEFKAGRFFRLAYRCAAKAANQVDASNLDKVEILKTTARLALRCGEAALARRLIDEALAADASILTREDWTELYDVRRWPDEWLLATTRRDPPDEVALDALVQRHWKALFGRCRMLTLNQPDAADLAQSTWCRVLQSRQRLNPGKRFGAYLAVIATNLWRDSMRSALRAGPMAKHRLISLDTALPGDKGSTITLKDSLLDGPSSHELDHRHLAIDLDRALAKLPPILREVLVARFIAGESCAEIGRRLGRTEQTISGCVRQAIRRMKHHCEEPIFAPGEGFNYEKTNPHCKTTSRARAYSAGRGRKRIQVTFGTSMLRNNQSQVIQQHYETLHQ
jgi:RNA polymerase sigma factor (sigma-70 family)